MLLPAYHLINGQGAFDHNDLGDELADKNETPGPCRHIGVKTNPRNIGEHPIWFSDTVLYTLFIGPLDAITTTEQLDENQVG